MFMYICNLKYDWLQLMGVYVCMYVTLWAKPVVNFDMK